VPVSIAISFASAQTFQCFTVLPDTQLRHAERDETDKPEGCVVLAGGDLHDFARQRERRLAARPMQFGGPEAGEYAERNVSTTIETSGLVI
jgi:hypothetical protein